jgi:DNA-binding transcriptional LysR family regulator
VNNLTLRQLRAFQAVANTQSFTEAAERLSLTPAALSGLVKELEAQLGVRLFDRNTRKVELSGMGAEFFPLTERVLSDLDDAVANITALKEKRRGIVRIAAPEVMSCTLVPSVMAGFREAYPDIELRFLDVSIEEVITRTARGEVDVGIAPGNIEAPEIHRTPFMRAPLMLAVPMTDPLAQKTSVSWLAARQRPFVSFFRSLGEWTVGEQGGERHSLFPADTTIVRRINTSLSMVKAGFGVSVCPLYANELAAGFDVKLIRLTDPELDREYALLTREGYALTPAVEAFCEFVRQFGPKWANVHARSMNQKAKSKK